MSFVRGSLPILRRCLLENSVEQSVSAVPRRFAGHSHWQNTRHIKAATDAHKASVTIRFVRLLEVAVVTGGGPDPKFNLLLANTIEQARKTQVITNAVIENTIKRAADPTAKKAVSTVMEFFGENGVMAVATVETASESRLRHDVKHICKKHTWGLARAGVKERFEEKTYVIVNAKQDGSAIDPDELLAVGIEGGAEDMNEIGDDKNRMYEFTCAAESKFVLMKNLQNGSYVMSDIGTKWVPMVQVEVDESYAKKVSDFCDALEEHPDVQGVFTNLA